MDASMALMNQYALISAQFPPLQTNSTPPTLTSTSTNSTETEEPTTSEEPEPEKLVKEEETSSASAPDIADDDGAGPSTSSIETLEIDGNIVTIEDIGPSDPNDPISEVRRRRLQRFELRNQDS